ncbi:Uma2 family endonuclease [uncultured Thiodictyon sp.]|nr:Uma2 family endonuclease [uncultured Thiodictyon sp.]
MHVLLPPHIDALVKARVDAGAYQSASDVICEALHLLDERDQLRDGRREVSLDDGYQAMAADPVREAEAQEWCRPGVQTHARPPLYQQLEALPEWMTAELIDGQVHTEPRPAALVLGTVSALLNRSPDERRDWCVLHWPELHLILDTEVLVPDLAAWRWERIRFVQEDQRFTIVPDWVCEILSPVTRSKDREIKMPIYARFGVAYLWLVDPWARTLETYALDAGVWRDIGRFGGSDVVAVAPFEATPIDLADVWMPTADE